MQGGREEGREGKGKGGKEEERQIAKRINPSHL